MQNNSSVKNTDNHEQEDYFEHVDIELEVDGFQGVQAAIPQIVSRSPLFGIYATSYKRKHVENMVISNYAAANVRYTGYELCQYDLDVFLALVKIAVDLKKTIFKIPFNHLVKVLHKKHGKTNENAIKSSFLRLVSGSLFVDNEAQETYGINNFFTYIDLEVGNILDVSINPKIAKIFVSSTWVDFDQRLKLGQAHYTKWLFNFVQSNKYPININKLQVLSGQDDVLAKEFKRKISAAFDSLVNNDVIISYDIDKKTGTISYLLNKDAIVKRTRKKNRSVEDVGNKVPFFKKYISKKDKIAASTTLDIPF